ncbi:DfsB family protein [Lactobacillus apis] [Lactiplantibacillus mudanjiangensis]|uniref:DfsB family protein [Lactobacillus apis] n=1 Tax=Lactiplantibacillus mudanjiangensis TaxID=1296538 RepID=A0A660E1S5_9LACO|nr:DfsB family protein [Lactobacillus apis] [Lactiplantibacillus mudanjiangensis]VDG22738.1 DfsB family protein [Lactobacillus apis] [Lactiplantibacillus mudanjiangensis]VDG26725.1 DfsB family protein [Lactobacillus apis] [Lactiplantibacillus mudanjiangensis]
MTRPTTKAELIEASQTQYAALLALIQTMPTAKQLADFTFEVPNETAVHWQRDRNVRDVISHLYE